MGTRDELNLNELEIQSELVQKITRLDFAKPSETRKIKAQRNR